MISIILPAYNEEKRIGKTLPKIIKHCRKRFNDYEIIVVSDGSKDRTVEIAKSHSKDKVRVLHNHHNRGKGYSVKKGLLAAKHPYVLFSDSDLATPIEELDNMMKHMIQGSDIVIASRNLKESNIIIKQPKYRQLMGKMFPLLVNIIALRGIKDTQCGFKLFRKKTAKRIARVQTLDKFAFDVEILLIARKLGYLIKEVPVKWKDQNGSKVSIIKDASRMFADLIQIRLNDLQGKYGVQR